MEEVLYNIEIRKEAGKYLGKMYSDVGGVKEFKDERIDRLFRDIIFDMELALDEFSNRFEEFSERREEIK